MISLSYKCSISPILKSCISPAANILSRNFAARKGTRERKAKKKVKVVVEKVGFIPQSQRNREKLALNRASRKFDDSWKMTPTTEVYCAKYYKWKVYPFEEAVQAHRETHHPEMYNQPNAPLLAMIELNMQGEKKTKFVDNFNRIAYIPHKFEHGEERPIIAFAKDTEAQKSASEAGAALSGGVELIKNIQNGKVSIQEFEFVIAHHDILHELSSLRGLLKKKYPSIKAGTLDCNLEAVVLRYLYGINYTAIKDEFEKDFGIIETKIGTLNMDPQHLEENFAALLGDVMVMKPKKSEKFIRRTYLMSPPSGEQFKIDHNLYVKDVQQSKVKDQEEVEEADEVVDQRVVQNF